MKQSEKWSITLHGIGAMIALVLLWISKPDKEDSISQWAGQYGDFYFYMFFYCAIVVFTRMACLSDWRRLEVKNWRIGRLFWKIDFKTMYGLIAFFAATVMSTNVNKAEYYTMHFVFTFSSAFTAAYTFFFQFEEGRRSTWKTVFKSAVVASATPFVLGVAERFHLFWGEFIYIGTILILLLLTLWVKKLQPSK